MIHVVIPYAVAAALVGLGVVGILGRRHSVLVLIGIELLLSGALVLLVTAGATTGASLSVGSVLSLFVITIAAAEVVVALAVILRVFSLRGSIDLRAPAGEPDGGER